MSELEQLKMSNAALGAQVRELSARVAAVEGLAAVAGEVSRDVGAAVAVCRECGVEYGQVAGGAKSFAGARGRVIRILKGRGWTTEQVCRVLLCSARTVQKAARDGNGENLEIRKAGNNVHERK